MREVAAEQFAQHLPRLRRFAYGLCGSFAVAEDLIQEAFTRLLASDGSQRGYIERWLFRTVRNLYIDQLRKAEVHERYDHEFRALNTSEMSDTGRSENLILLEHIREMIGRLPSEQREVLLLIGVEGHSYREAAEILSLPMGTVTSRLARAREKLIADYTGENKESNDVNEVADG